MHDSSISHHKRILTSNFSFIMENIGSKKNGEKTKEVGNKTKKESYLARLTKHYHYPYYQY